MNDDNFLSDLESDIDGDWKDIQQKIKDKEIEEETIELMENPQRFMFPSFKEFYVILCNILQSWRGSRDLNIETMEALHKLLRGVFYCHDTNHKEVMPKGFDKIWKIFCDPIEYECKDISCNYCRKEYNIFYQKEGRRRISYFEDHYQETMQLKVNNVYCYKCGGLMARVSGNVVSVFESDHDGEKKYVNESEFRVNF